MLRTVVLVTVLVGLGASGGYLAGVLRAPSPAPVAAPAVRAAADRAPIVVADHGLSEAELRRIVREELAAAGRQGPGEASTPAPAQPGNPAAFDEGMRHVTQAIAHRQWTPDDAIALDRTLEATSPEQRAEILHTLVPALNRGEIKLTYRGALF